MVLVTLLGLSVSFVLITMDVQANPVLGAISEDRGFSEQLQQSASPDQLPLRFPSGDWPWYAQGEIFLNPEPPIPGVPAEICAGVNDDLNTPTSLV
jgi:hypothetical protein